MLHSAWRDTPEQRGHVCLRPGTCPLSPQPFFLGGVCSVLNVNSCQGSELHISGLLTLKTREVFRATYSQELLWTSCKAEACSLKILQLEQKAVGGGAWLCCPPVRFVVEMGGSRPGFPVQFT